MSSLPLFSASLVHASLAICLIFVPLLLLLPARLALNGTQGLSKAWSFTQGLLILGFIVSILTGIAVWQWGATSVSAASWLPTIRLDALTTALLLLTYFLGWVIVRYSQQYLAGDRGQDKYLLWICLTLISVLLLVSLNNLLLVCIAWTLTSVTLHQLLTFYNNRPAAILAAHKKFLISRMADMCMYVATLLIFLSLGTIQIDQITQILVQANSVDTKIHVAALLVVLAAILKCAQLPFHGWLLQVMEAPTPVSALLHAGIVNIGGFVLLRLISLLEVSPFAQLVLVIAGSVTAVMAALVMMTRVSVKVMLAWSTCAQMGFMLLEIGLGAYSLALLHLLAHSLYKAHAFLAAGDTVAQYRKFNLVSNLQTQSIGFYSLALGALLLSIVLGGYLTGINPLNEPVMWVLGGVLACSLIPLVTAPTQKNPIKHVVVVSAYAFGLVCLYGLLHTTFKSFLPVTTASPPLFNLAFAGLAMLTLLVVQQMVLTHPSGKFATWLHPKVFAGFHLDDLFTRVTLSVWPLSAGSANIAKNVNSKPT